MSNRSITARFVALASMTGLLLVAAAPSPAAAAEIKLLGPVSLRVVLPSVLPQIREFVGA